jgi:hypothetical protein
MGDATLLHPTDKNSGYYTDCFPSSPIRSSNVHPKHREETSPNKNLASHHRNDSGQSSSSTTHRVSYQSHTGLAQ